MKRSAESHELLKPVDDVSFKQEDIFPDAAVAQEKSLFSLSMPSWLRYYMEIWNEILSRRNDLKVQFPLEFETDNDFNEAPTSNTQEESEFGLMQSNSEVTIDESGHFLDGAAANWATHDENSVFETSDSSFENVDGNGFEIQEAEQESGIHDDTGADHTLINAETEQEISNSDSIVPHMHDSELPEVKHEIENNNPWVQGNVFSNIGMSGNWMQGMVDSAMTVLPNIIDRISDDTKQISDDIPDRLSKVEFETTGHIHPNSFQSGGEWNSQVANQGARDISDDSSNSGSGVGFVLVNPSMIVPVPSLEAASILEGQSRNSIPDNEQDSSS